MYFALLLIIAGSVYGVWTHHIPVQAMPVIFLLAIIADQLYLIRDFIVRFGTAHLITTKKSSKEDTH